MFVGPHPAGQVNFINTAGRIERVVPATGLHPLFIFPGIVQVPGNGGGIGSFFPEIGIGVAFVGFYALKTVDMVFVYFLLWARLGMNPSQMPELSSRTYSGWVVGFQSLKLLDYGNPGGIGAQTAK